MQTREDTGSISSVRLSARSALGRRHRRTLVQISEKPASVAQAGIIPRAPRPSEDPHRCARVLRGMSDCRSVRWRVRGE
jgi:hypothetical protein